MDLSSTTSDSESVISGIEPLILSSLNSSAQPSPREPHQLLPPGSDVAIVVDSSGHRSHPVYSLEPTVRMSDHEGASGYSRPKGTRVQLFKDDSHANHVDDLEEGAKSPEVDAGERDARDDESMEIAPSGDKNPEPTDLASASSSAASVSTVVRSEASFVDRHASGDSSSQISPDIRKYQINGHALPPGPSESESEEEAVEEPAFSLQPVVHERPSSAVMEDEDPGEEDGQRHDQLLQEGYDGDINYSESTEADQYVMHPEADQSEIGIASGVTQTEPRPVVVGRSDFASEYGDHLQGEDDSYDDSGLRHLPDDSHEPGRDSDDESQSDMPEDNLNFVNRQIEGEDEDEEDSIRQASSVSSRAHSSLAQSDQNIGVGFGSLGLQHPDPPGGNVEITDQIRHDLVLMPQRVPPSGAAESHHTVPLTQSLSVATQSHLSDADRASMSPSLSPTSGPPHHHRTREAVLGATASANTTQTSSQSSQQNDRSSDSLRSDQRGARPKQTQNNQRSRRPSDEPPSRGSNRSRQPKRTIPKTVASSSGASGNQINHPIMGTASLKPEPGATEVKATHRAAHMDYQHASIAEHNSKMQQQQNVQLQLLARLHNLQLQRQQIQGQRSSEVDPYPQQVTPTRQKPRARTQGHEAGPENIIPNLSPISMASQNHMLCLSPGGSSAYDMLHNVSLTSMHSNTDIRYKDVTTDEIQKMENVRGQLAQMLSMSNVSVDRGSYDQCNESMAENSMTRSLAGMSDVTSQLEEMLAFTSRQLRAPAPHNIPPPNPPRRSMAELLADNHSLMETLEKEKYRRKHCEKQIQQLQSKILELQQQLAVSVSTDRKKDMMIEQLDKTLAKLVEGWQRKDAEKEERLRMLAAENAQLNIKDDQQSKLICQFESQLTETINQLKELQDQSSLTEQQHVNQISFLEQELNDVKEALGGEREQSLELQSDLEAAQRENQQLVQELEESRQQHAEDKETWEEREKEYLQRVQDMTDNHLKLMEASKKKTEEQAAKCQELQNVVHTTTLELQQRLLDLEAAMREKESLKVEIGILEAKGETALRKLETDLQAQAEREMSKRLEEARAKHASAEEQVRERHRRQITELNQGHTQEMQDQLRRYQDDLRRQEDKWRVQQQAYEDRLEKLQSDIEDARRYNQNLEEQRQEITDKLQGLMQSHCNETLRLLQLGSQGLQTPAILHMGPLLCSRELTSPSSIASDKIHQVSAAATSTSIAFPNSLPHSSAFVTVKPSTKSVSFQEPIKSERPENDDDEDDDDDANDETESNSAEREEAPVPRSQPTTPRDPLPSSQPMLSYPTVISPFSNPSLISLAPSMGSQPHLFTLPSSSASNPILLHSPVMDRQLRVSADFSLLSNDGRHSADNSFSSPGFHISQGDNHVPQRDVNPPPRGVSFLSSILQQDQTSTASPLNNSSESTAQEPERLLSNMDSRFEEHEQRQAELQYYISMLLNRPQGMPTDSSQLEAMMPSSEQRPCDVPASKPEEVTPPRHDHPPAFSKTLVTTAPPNVPMATAAQAAAASASPEVSQDNKVLLSPKQMGEISRLLGLYSRTEQSASDAQASSRDPPVEELYTYLRDLQTRNSEISQSNQSTPTHDNPRPLSQKAAAEAAKHPKTKAPSRGKMGETHVIHIPTGAESGHSPSESHAGGRNPSALPKPKSSKSTSKGQSKKPDRKPAVHHDGKNTKGAPAWK